VGDEFGMNASIVHYCFVGNERDIKIFVKGENGYIEVSFCDFSKGF